MNVIYALSIWDHLAYLISFKRNIICFLRYGHGRLGAAASGDEDESGKHYTIEAVNKSMSPGGAGDSPTHKHHHHKHATVNEVAEILMAKKVALVPKWAH
jgi:hypothetical protein